MSERLYHGRISRSASLSTNNKRLALAATFLVGIVFIIWNFKHDDYLEPRDTVFDNDNGSSIILENLLESNEPETYTTTASGQLSMHVQRRIKSRLNCLTIVDNENKEEISRADFVTKEYRNFKENKTNGEPVVSEDYLNDLLMIPDENFIFEETKCQEFINIRGYNNYSVSDEEKAFPFAFSILTYEHAEQFERLLHAIYRPQNVYCIHVDSKSSAKFQQAIRSITRCFPNVFIATKLERVIWGGYSRLIADIDCMKDLLMAAPESKLPDDAKTQVNIDKFWSHENMKNKKFRNDWKYLFNLASTEFPIRTNKELVQIMTIYNGTNDIEMIKFPPGNLDRIKYYFLLDEPNDKIIMTEKRKPPPPFNFTVVKGIVYSSFSRSFIEFALNSVEARAYLEWLRETYISDESYWGTLQYNVKFKPPGSFEKILPDDYLAHNTRYMGWPSVYPCDKGGYRRNSLCMFSNGDLHHLSERSNFFLNKFQLKDDPIAYACIEDWYSRRLKREDDLVLKGQQVTIDMTPYCKYLYKMSSGKIYKGCERFQQARN